MDDIQEQFKENIGEFMEKELEAEMDEECGYNRCNYRNKSSGNSRNGHSSKKLITSLGDRAAADQEEPGVCHPGRGEQDNVDVREEHAKQPPRHHIRQGGC